MPKRKKMPEDAKKKLMGQEERKADFDTALGPNRQVSAMKALKISRNATTGRPTNRTSRQRKATRKTPKKRTGRLPRSSMLCVRMHRPSGANCPKMHCIAALLGAGSQPRVYKSQLFCEICLILNRPEGFFSGGWGTHTSSRCWFRKEFEKTPKL